MLLHFRTSVFVTALVAGLFLFGCGGSKPAETVTVTAKKDGSHFTGTVVRREANSITLANSDNDVRTFLYSEIQDVRSVAADSPMADTAKAVPATAASGGNGTPNPKVAAAAPVAIAPGGMIVFPAGTEFPVAASGYFDSCCVPLGAFAPGKTDEAVKLGGNVIIPKGSNVTVMLMDEKTVDGRVTMKFELGSVDIDGKHYIMSSTKGEAEPGAIAVFTGAKEGTQEAKTHGLNVHIDENALMPFKAATPTSIRLSK